MPTPVLFRKDQNEVTAVFPTLPGTDYYNMTCYAHVGQHSACTFGWYHTTKPAKPDEFADLHQELVAIGYDDLKICQRITRRHDDERRRNADPV